MNRIGFIGSIFILSCCVQAQQQVTIGCYERPHGFLEITLEENIVQQAVIHYCINQQQFNLRQLVDNKVCIKELEQMDVIEFYILWQQEAEQYMSETIRYTYASACAVPDDMPQSSKISVAFELNRYNSFLRTLMYKVPLLWKSIY